MFIKVHKELATYKEFIVIPNLNGSILARCCNPPTFLAICTRGWNCSPTLNCLWLNYTLVLLAIVDVPQSQSPEHGIQSYDMYQNTVNAITTLL